MRKTALFFSFILAYLFFIPAYNQILPEVSTPSLELQDNKLVIQYDIRNYNPDDKFRVSIEVTDSEGKVLSAHSLSGDIGNDVSGGNKKQITWDFKQDNITTDTDIYVQVSIEIQAPPPVAVDETIREEPVAEETAQEEKVKTGGLILRSALVPGLGFVKMDKSYWHLAKGVAGYGCIASAIIFNRMAVSNYNKYLDSYEVDKSDDYYTASLRQDNLSEVFAYTAIGIWAAEMVWILIESKNYKSTSNTYGKGFSVEPGYDPYSNTSLICLSYNF